MPLKDNLEFRYAWLLPKLASIIVAFLFISGTIFTGVRISLSLKYSLRKDPDFSYNEDADAIILRPDVELSFFNKIIGGG